MDTAKDFLTPRQAAELLRTTPATIRLWIAARKLPAARPSGRWLIRRADVERLLLPVGVQPLPQTSAEVEARRKWTEEGIERMRGKR